MIYGLSFCAHPKFPSLFADSVKVLVAGTEHAQIINRIAEHVDTLQVISTFESYYLNKTKEYKETPDSDLMQEARSKWFDDVSMLKQRERANSISSLR